VGEVVGVSWPETREVLGLAAESKELCRSRSLSAESLLLLLPVTQMVGRAPLLLLLSPPPPTPAAVLCSSRMMRSKALGSRSTSTSQFRRGGKLSLRPRGDKLS